MPADSDEYVSRAELADRANLVDVDRLRDLLAPITRRGERVSKAYVNEITRDARHRFPRPLIDHRRMRIWLLRDVEAWLAERLRDR